MNEQGHHDNKFFNGFVIGAVIGAAIVFLVATEKGKKILKLLADEGLENISNLLENYSDKEELEEDPDEVENEDLVDQAAEAKSEAEKTSATNGEVKKEETSPKSKKRFFKKS